MNEVAVTFTPDGTGHALHTECIDLGQIGRLTLTRATDIEFDGESQLWCVRRPGSRFSIYRNASRQACLDWERRYLEAEEDREHQSMKAEAPGQLVLTGLLDGKVA